MIGKRSINIYYIYICVYIYIYMYVQYVLYASTLAITCLWKRPYDMGTRLGPFSRLTANGNPLSRTQALKRTHRALEAFIFVKYCHPKSIPPPPFRRHLAPQTKGSFRKLQVGPFPTTFYVYANRFELRSKVTNFSPEQLQGLCRVCTFTKGRLAVRL